jgi:hypothetical protein
VYIYVLRNFQETRKPIFKKQVEINKTIVKSKPMNMKLRTLITLVLVTVALSTVTAQKAKHFEVGLLGGYGSSWIINQNNYGLPEMDYDYYYGGGFSIQGGYNFTDNMGLFTEVGMLNSGQSYKDTWEHNAEITRTIDMKYLNIPVFFKYTVGESRARFRLLVGPQFSFLQKADQEYTINGTPMPDNPLFYRTDKDGNDFFVGETDIKDRFNSLDIALVLDLGVDIFLMEDILYLSLAARMYYGLTDINADAYQINNYDGNYDPSHRAGGVLYLGVNYIIGGGSGE